MVTDILDDETGVKGKKITGGGITGGGFLMELYGGM